MGDKNSSHTRVAPIFNLLHCIDPTGASWLDRIVSLGSRQETVEQWIRPQSLESGHKRRWGATEASLPAPMALLEYLIYNLDPSSVDGDEDEEVFRKRRALAARDPGVIAEAIQNLHSTRHGKRWWILEGPSRPDALLETERSVLCIEGKRTEPFCTTSTKFMERRSQLLRHMDAAMEAFPSKQIFGLLVVEGDGGARATEPSEHWKAQCDAQYSEEMLEGSLPHRTLAQRRAIADGVLGLTTWQAVCAEFCIPWPPVQ